MIIVLDTNVLVSALLSPFGTPARILDLLLAGDLRLAYDDRILSEYRQVLARPRFGFNSHTVADLIAHLVADGLPTTTYPWPVSLPDPDDLPFLEVAQAANAVLITGNRRHFPRDACRDVRIASPTEFLTRLALGH